MCLDAKGHKAAFSGADITGVEILPGQPETFRIRTRENVQGGLTAEGVVRS
jgi:hypothetical protein